MWPESEQLLPLGREMSRWPGFTGWKEEGLFGSKEGGSEGPERLAELGQQGRAAGKHLGVYFLYL